MFLTDAEKKTFDSIIDRFNENGVPCVTFAEAIERCPRNIAKRLQKIFTISCEARKGEELEGSLSLVQFVDEVTAVARDYEKNYKVIYSPASILDCCFGIRSELSKPLIRSLDFFVRSRGGDFVERTPGAVWEKIPGYDGNILCEDMRTWRTKTPTGWVMTNEEGSLLFVPDPKHEWLPELTKEVKDG